MKDDITTQDLEDLRTMLLDVIDKAEGMAISAGGAGMHAVEVEMMAYLIPHLTTWAENPRQIGSIPSLIATLDEWIATLDYEYGRGWRGETEMGFDKEKSDGSLN